MNVTLLSDKNPLVKDVRKAARQGDLTSSGFALAEGPHLLEEALRSGVEIGPVIATESARIPGGATITHWVSNATFASLATTESPQGVLALVRPRPWSMEDILGKQALSGKHALIAILDGIQDPGNAGAIVRTAEAFGAAGVVFLTGCVHAHNPKCMRASAGSLFRVPYVVGVTPEELLNLGLPLFAADGRAKTPLSEAKLPSYCGMVIGSEGRGVSPALAGRAQGVRIPTTGVESLNAAVAAGILMYEARRQRSPMYEARRQRSPL